MRGEHDGPAGVGPLADSAIRFLGTAQALTDDELHDALALPGWTRAHVLTHVAQAADSRTGLLRAAQAGRVGQQYSAAEASAEAINAGAGRPPAVIRADAHRAVQECLTAVREHPAPLWDAPARAGEPHCQVLLPARPRPPPRE